MTANACPREDELLDALGRGLVGAELRAHVAGCAPCGELQLIAGALLDERVQAVAEAPVPSAGTMWFRLQLRRRQEAQATARRTLLVGQAVTLAIALWFVVTIFGSDIALAARDTVTTLRLSTPVLLTILASVLLVPIGGYVAIRQK